MTAKTMLAYRLPAFGEQPQLVEVPVPSPAPGEALIRVAANGLCHSDLTMPQIPAEFGQALGWQTPFTLGHEVAGWVEKLGPDTTGPEPGTAVALVSPASCGRCPSCLRGRDSVCRHSQTGRGYGRDGGLAAYVLAPAARALVPLGDLDPVSAAPLTDAGATSYHAVRRVLSRLQPGGTVAVLGAGGLGSFAIQHLKALSAAHVIAVDPDPVRRKLALELGAVETLTDVSEMVGDEMDAVLDFVGVDATIAAGLGAVRPAGIFGLVGAAGGKFRKPWYGGLPREAEIFTIQGSRIADLHDVLALAADGQVHSPVQVMPLKRVAEAYEALERGGLSGRVVVTP